MWYPTKIERFWRLGLTLLLMGFCVWYLTPAAGRAAEVVVVDEDFSMDSALPAPAVYWEEIRSEPRPLQLHFLLVNLKAPGIRAAVAVSADPDGSGPASATLLNPVAFAKERGFFAAVNANAFMHLLDASEEEKKRGWYLNKPVRLFGLTIENGQLRNPHQDARLPLWFDSTGKAHVGKPADADVPEFAVADWEGPILQNGKLPAEKRPALLPRTLAGIDAAGGRLLMVVVEGRKKGVSEGMTLEECGRLMLEKGCTDAVNFDGGGSAVMLITTEGKLRAVGHPPGRYLRPIPVMLGIQCDQK